MAAAETAPASGAIGSAPASAMRGSSRASATTGAAEPSSAQLHPPNAIIDVPTSAVRNTIVRSRVMRPSPAASATDHATSAFAASTTTKLNASGRSRRRVDFHCSSKRLRRRVVNRSMTQSESPNSRTSLAAGASTARRYAYSAWRCAARTSSVLRSRHTADSRSR
jgi:hypothetical protein